MQILSIGLSQCPGRDAHPFLSLIVLRARSGHSIGMDELVVGLLGDMIGTAHFGWSLRVLLDGEWLIFMYTQSAEDELVSLLGVIARCG